MEIIQVMSIERRTAERIAACGNDCLACPRYTAYPYEKTEDELLRTAELWMQIGYRDHVVSIDEIACFGCRPENSCRYGVKRCCEDRRIASCAECGEYPCGMIRKCFLLTESFRTACRKECTEEEYDLLSRAFFEKENNLNRLRDRNIPEEIY